MQQPILKVQLFGGFSLIYDSSPVIAVNTARLQSLLTFLILHADSPQSRQRVAFLLWPDKPESQALNNLRQFIYQLRRALPDPDRFLYTDTTVIYWKTDEAQVIDLRIFQQAQADATVAEEQDNQSLLLKSLESAISVYQGDLIPGCYEDWIVPDREHLRQLCQNTCRKFVSLLEARREYASALKVGRKLLQFDPLDEDAYFVLLRLHELNGDPVSARRIYQVAADILQRELGIEPNEPLHLAYQRLQNVSIMPFTSSEDGQSTGSSFKLVGRQSEWETLLSAWERTFNGNTQLALITGEAGIGKSRLAEELFNWAIHQGFTTSYTRSYGAEGSLALAPITEWLRSSALRPHLPSLDPIWMTEIARLLPEILNEYPKLPHPEPINEYGQRQRFFEALARGVLAAPKPLLLWIDDLQWCDQETLEWLHFLLRFKPHNSVLILGTARSEEAPPEHSLSLLTRQLQIEDRVTIIELSPLDAAETAKLAYQIQGYDLDDSASIHLFHETEGNPLFVVETIRASMDRIRNADASILITSDQHILPPKVQATILRRLVNLSPVARKIVEIGAANGRTFTFDLLQLIGQYDDDTIIHALDELWQKRIVREQSPNVFDFTHDKLREVAYLETSPPQRRLLHRRIARALRTLHAEHLEPISGQLAAQYAGAGLAQEALAYFEIAAVWAQNIFAHNEAIRLLLKALTLLETVQNTKERNEQELTLQTYLGISMVSTKGYGAMEVLKAYSRAQELCNQLGKPVTSPVLRALAIAHLSHTEFNKALVIGNQLLEYVEEEQDIVLVVEAHYILGVTLSWQGVFDRSCWHLKKAIDNYDPAQAHTHITMYSQDPKAVCLIRLALALACLGYPEQADQASQASQAYALELSHPFTRAYIMTWETLQYQYRRETQKTLELAESTIRFCSEYQLEYWRTITLVFHGWALAEQTNFEAGIAEMEQGISAFQATGSEFVLPYFHALLGEQYGKQGDFKKGLMFVNDGIAQVERSGEKWCEAELFRIKGELLRLQGDSAEAEIAFRHAIVIAQKQKAKLLELRAAISLNRLEQSNSGLAAAKEILTKAYDWFTEGFETVDLRTARQLIA